MKRPRKPKAFRPGQAVEFQRTVGSTWERGIYVRKYDPAEWRGWHSVKLCDDAPARYINSMNGVDCDREHPQAFRVHSISVPTQRLREQT